MYTTSYGLCTFACHVANISACHATTAERLFVTRGGGGVGVHLEKTGFFFTSVSFLVCLRSVIHSLLFNFFLFFFISLN